MGEPGDTVIRRTEMWASGALSDDAPLLRAVLDASPAAAFVVDEDMRVLLLNLAGRQLLGVSAGEARDVLQRRAGDLARCLEALAAPQGCGRGEACGGCALRGSVRRAAAGDEVVRARALLHVERPAGAREAHLLVSAAPIALDGRRLVVLTLEDLSEQMRLSSLLPICFHCRRVRDEDHYWRTVEDYFKSRADVDFSHTLCDECLDEHYPARQAAGDGGSP